MKVTIVKEIGRYKRYACAKGDSGYDVIKWRCKSCGHIMNLPQQQNFNFCFHCGRKVIAQFGGKGVVANA